jgi:hypothetical protein
VESGAPTTWVPQSKPVWFTELGCPAVDKGANQPNVFVDAKSTESALPSFSRGTRDDLIQRRYLQAFLEAFDPAHAGYIAGSNPISSVDAARMVDLDHVHVYAWDARPYPAFPANTAAWGDGENWRLGHWLNGRSAAQPLSALLARLLQDYTFSEFDISALDGIIAGVLIDRIMSAREAIEPLGLACFFDAVETGGAIRFRQRSDAVPVAAVTFDDLVEDKPEADLVTLTRAQETDLPASARVSYSASESDYRQAVVESRRLIGASGRVALAELPVVMEAGQAAQTADAWLFETWAARERASFALPPSRLALEPGDVVSLEVAGQSRMLRIAAVGEHGTRDIEAIGIDPDVYAASTDALRPQTPAPDMLTGQPLGLFLDLPLLTGTERPEAGYVAAAQQPWPGAVAFYRSPETSGYTLRATATVAATTGETLDALPSGPEGRLDAATRIRVRLDRGELSSVTRIALLAGANAAAIETGDGTWEVLQFQTATLVAPATYELSSFLRAQAGTDGAMLPSLAAGARFVLIDAALTPVDMSSADIGLPFNWRFGPASRNLGDATYATASHTFTGAGLRPLSPVHVRGSRASGDLTITWVRRTRIGGDSWGAPEVPLAEENESYEVDILDGSTVVRTLAASTPSVVYTAAEQTIDFARRRPPVRCASTNSPPVTAAAARALQACDADQGSGQ